MSLVRCPQCELPAKVTDRFSFPSTDGPIEHVKTVCAAGHWFTPRAADVQAIPEAGALRRTTVARRRAA